MKTKLMTIFLTGFSFFYAAYAAADSCSDKLMAEARRQIQLGQLERTGVLRVETRNAGFKSEYQDMTLEIFKPGSTYPEWLMAVVDNVENGVCTGSISYYDNTDHSWEPVIN